MLRSAERHWDGLGNDLNRAKSQAVLGRALFSIGAFEEATELAESGFELFRAGDYAGEQPQLWLWSLSQLLDGLGRRADADEVLEAARQELVRQASSIGDPERRRGFFELVPLNRSIVAACDARSRTKSKSVVELARATAPLGRTLRPDERVEVCWTLHATDDDAIRDPVALRRHRLQRLLDEAAAQAGSPTDDDLADALRVSRRTILRDMAMMGEGSRPATRRRRAALAERSVSH